VALASVDGHLRQLTWVYGLSLDPLTIVLRRRQALGLGHRTPFILEEARPQRRCLLDMPWRNGWSALCTRHPYGRAEHRRQQTGHSAAQLDHALDGIGGHRRLLTGHAQPLRRILLSLDRA